MPGKKIHQLKTITEFHRSRGLPPPHHPLISVVNYADLQLSPEAMDAKWVFDFYCIAVKRNLNAKFHYGQQDYDFDEGVMFFIAPGQVFSVSLDDGVPWERSGWIMVIHPDFLWNTPLASTISRYEYFDYSVHEALHLSKVEEDTMISLISIIEQEYRNTVDRFSQLIIISHLETMLVYADRFYQRQFITRNISNHRVLAQFENTLKEYFGNDRQVKSGVPTVQYMADSLNVSASYLSSLLKTLTGQTTQQHIHNFLIEKAKEKLSTTELTVSEIAYELGFEHPQSLSKLFKAKTNLSPLGFRERFN